MEFVDWFIELNWVSTELDAIREEEKKVPDEA